MFIDDWFVATTSPPPGTRPGGGHWQEAENLLPQGYMTRGERVFQSYTSFKANRIVRFINIISNLKLKGNNENGFKWEEKLE